ncbi:virulence factor [Agilicoccus flavus]|uniref:virulence factor n=1 Tax=Agilicoccus flavus TaxID=2775968 RepID=UPI001CF62364|nr:virulence factor [Agilicoccus flavus]
MTEYQIMSWRDLPSMLTVRDGDETRKVSLAPRFQEAIDEAAMRLGATGSGDYLDGWARGEWTPTEGDVTEAAERLSAELEARWDQGALDAYLDDLGPASA